MRKRRWQILSHVTLAHSVSSRRYRLRLPGLLGEDCFFSFLMKNRRQFYRLFHCFEAVFNRFEAVSKPRF